MSTSVILAILVTSLATFSSRLLGVISSEGIKETSKLFRWFNCLAYSTLAALIARTIIFPVGVLSDASYLSRIVVVLFCSVIGIPIGIAASRSNLFEKILRPILDVMQTIPSFVYLIPVVMLFGIGITPGVIAIIIFSIAPVIRLTNLGLRQVEKRFKDAARALGCNKWQVLYKIELPLALKTIMAGVNQTLMLSLSMAVIAALIGAGGLGLTVYVGLGRLDIGQALVGGIGIVLIAIIFDRISQKFI